MQPGTEPDIKKFLFKIVNTVSWVLLWMMSAATAGIYFELGDPGVYPGWVTAIYYTILVVTLALLVRYLIRKWKPLREG